MAKIVSPDRLSGSNEVAKNSLVATYGLPVNVELGVVNQAGVGEKIEWIAVETKTFASDNETVAKAKLEFVRLKDETEVEFAVTNGSLVPTSVGTLFDLAADGTVDFGALTPFVGAYILGETYKPGDKKKDDFQDVELLNS